MARPSLFGDRPVGAVALVEAPVSRLYVRKARIALYTVAALVGPLTAAALAAAVHPVLALVSGALIGVLTGLLVAAVVRMWPVLRALWHWAAEIAALSVAAGLVLLLARATFPLLALAVVAAVAALLGGVAPVRRRVSAWGWCAVVRHRLRVCFAEFIRSATRTAPSRLPLILLARPTPAGERVWVWLRPGLDLTDLEGKATKVAVACWAAEARVVRASTRYAALMRVDITRRDPLTGRVFSPLVAVVPSGFQADVSVSSGMPPLGLDLPDVPEEIPLPNPRARR